MELEKFNSLFKIITENFIDSKKYGINHINNHMSTIKFLLKN